MVVLIGHYHMVVYDGSDFPGELTVSTAARPLGGEGAQVHVTAASCSTHRPTGAIH